MVIFGTGVVTGGLLMRYAAGTPAPRPGRGPAMGRQGQFPIAGILRVEFLRRAARELELTAEQQ